MAEPDANIYRITPTSNLKYLFPPFHSKDMLRKFFRDAFWIGVTNLLLQLKGLILIPLLSKKFGAIGYGAWAQASVLVGMLAPLVTLGMDQGYARFMPARSREKQAEFLWTQIWIHTFVSLICFSFLWFFAKPLASFLLDNESEYLLICACGLVIYSSLLINDFQAFYKVGQNVRVLNIAILIRGFGNLAAVVGVYLMGGGVLEIVLAGAVFDLLLAITFLAAIAYCHAISGIDRTMAKKFLSYGWILIPTGYAMWVINASDRFVLAYYGSLQDIGVYSAMYSLGYGFIPLLVRPFRAMYPTVATKLYENNDFAEIQRLFNYSVKAMLFFVIMILLILILFARDITKVFAAEEFLRGSFIIPIIFVSYVINVLASYYSVNLSLSLKQKVLTISLIIACTSNILLNFILIPLYGIYGAAIATLIAFFIDLSICMYFSNKIIFLKLDKIFIIKCLSISCSISIIILAMNFSPNGLYEICLTIISIFSVYTLGCLCLKAISRDEINLFLKYLTE